MLLKIGSDGFAMNSFGANTQLILLHRHKLSSNEPSPCGVPVNRPKSYEQGASATEQPQSLFRSGDGSKRTILGIDKEMDWITDAFENSVERIVCKIQRPSTDYRLSTLLAATQSS